MSDSHFLARSRSLVTRLSKFMGRLDLDKSPSRLGGPSLVFLAGSFSLLSDELDSAYKTLRPHVAKKVKSAKKAVPFGNKSLRLETKDFIVSLTDHHKLEVPSIDEVVTIVRKKFPDSGDLYTDPSDWLCTEADRRAPGMLYLKKSYSLKPGVIDALKEVLGPRFSEFVSEDVKIGVHPEKYNSFMGEQDSELHKVVASIVEPVPQEPRLTFVPKKK